MGKIYRGGRPIESETVSARDVTVCDIVCGKTGSGAIEKSGQGGT
jgi:hypothetical protein